MKPRAILMTVALLLIVAVSVQATIKYVPYNNEDENGDYTAKLIPYFLWACGCTPTSASMTLGYWDNWGPIGGGGWGKYTSWGRLIIFYLDETALETYTDGDGDHFVWGHYPSPGLARSKTCVYLAQYMDTDAPDGSTSRSNQHTGINEWTDSVDYGDNWASRYYKFWPWDNEVWEEIHDEIDAGYPCLVSIPGHSVCAYGYDSTADVIFTYDTWNEYRHDFDEDEFENLNRVHPQGGVANSDVDLHAPDGGETLSGSTTTITWYQWDANIDVKIYYSTNGGYNRTTITTVTNPVAGWNNYTWTIPSSINSTRCRIILQGLSGTNTRSWDGSQSNITIN